MIFLSGVHGVGKSYTCDKIKKKITFDIYSASKIIAKYKNEVFKNDKKILDIKGNQNYLTEGLKLELGERNDFILDGHFCLLDKNGDVSKIPINTFESLNIDAIVVIIDDVEKIVERLQKRDGIKHSFSKVKKFQDEEVRYAKEVSAKLEVELLVFKNSEILKDLTNIIKRNIK